MSILLPTSLNLSSVSCTAKHAYHFNRTLFLNLNCNSKFLTKHHLQLRTTASGTQNPISVDTTAEETEVYEDASFIDGGVDDDHADKGNYSNYSQFLEEAFKDDRELQDIIGGSIEDPEEMQKRMQERFKRKEKEIFQAKTGSAIPMKVSFREFDPTDSYIWMELYNPPSEKDIDIIGSVIRSWYLLGCLGGYNSLNMQLTRIPVNERLIYNENVDDDILPARFNNIGELEFQQNCGRFWVDLGTSDPLALDIFINSLIAVSSDYVGIKELIFGGKDIGDWNDEIKTEEQGYMSFKI